MEIITELHFPATSQKDIWAVMGGMDKLKNWLSPEGYYLLPETIEKVREGNDTAGEWWRLGHDKEGIEYIFEVTEQEWTRLGMVLMEVRGNPLPIEFLSHDIQLHFDADSKDNSTIVLWITNFDYGKLNPNRLKNWYLKRELEREIKTHIEELQAWSLKNLYGMVVKHDTSTDEPSSDWWEREFFDEFSPPPEMQAA